MQMSDSLNMLTAGKWHDLSFLCMDTRKPFNQEPIKAVQNSPFFHTVNNTFLKIPVSFGVQSEILGDMPLYFLKQILRCVERPLCRCWLEDGYEQMLQEGSAAQPVTAMTAYRHHPKPTLLILMFCCHFFIHFRGLNISVV